MCGRVLSKEFILLDLGLNRITLTAMLRTQPGDMAEGRERWKLGPRGRGRDGKLSSLCFPEMTDFFLFTKIQDHVLLKVSFPPTISSQH